MTSARRDGALLPPLCGEGGPAQPGRVGFAPIRHSDERNETSRSDPTRRASRATLPKKGREEAAPFVTTRSTVERLRRNGCFK